MPNAARKNDMVKASGHAHGSQCCPHNVVGYIMQGSPDVYINGLPAARVQDMGQHMACCGPNTFKLTKGSDTVFVNGKALMRKGDETTHCGISKGQVTTGSGDVYAN